jgi:hypothetical protein
LRTPVVRIGLCYGSGALPSSKPAERAGSGYLFGYFDADRSLWSRRTRQKKITMIKNKLMYLQNGAYYDTAVSGGTKIGCYHIDSGEAFGRFDEASDYAARGRKSGYPAFPAYINGGSGSAIEHYSKYD